MNRIDRQHLSAMTDSVNASAPIGLNTATGTPDFGFSTARPAASVADDTTVANSSNIIDPKPGSKFAQPENFGTVPVGMNSHGDYTGPGLAPSPSPSRTQQGSPQQDQVIAPKPGSKFAWPDEEDECGAMPAPLSSAQSDGTDAPSPGEVPLAEEATYRQYPDARPPQPVTIPTEQHRPAASVPDDMSLSNSGEILSPKPGTKFAAALTQR